MQNPSGVRNSPIIMPAWQDAAVKVLGFDASHAGILDSAEVSGRLNRILAEEAARFAKPSAIGGD